MPVLRSKTVQNENHLVDFLEQNNIPGLVGSPDYTVNSSGFLTIFFNDATQDRATTAVYDNGPASGTISAAITAGQYSSRINVANASKLIIGLEVNTATSSSDLHLSMRLSNLGNPDVDTAADWFTALHFSEDASLKKFDAYVKEFAIDKALLATGAKFQMEVPVAANWANIVLHNADTTARFSLYADVA
jgi:hypothetical protein